MDSMNIPPRYLEQLLTESRAHPEIRRVILFGSRARGDNAERADIDIAVDAPGMDMRAWSDYHEHLTEEAQTLLEVDLVRLEQVSDVLRERIDREGRVVYERTAGAGEPRFAGRGSGKAD